MVQCHTLKRKEERVGIMSILSSTSEKSKVYLSINRSWSSNSSSLSCYSRILSLPNSSWSSLEHHLSEIKLSFLHPCSGELWIKAPSVENTELEGSPFKAWGRSLQSYMLRLLPGISSLLISTLPVHSPAFFPKPAPSFSCVSCG